MAEQQVFGQELIAQLEDELQRWQQSREERQERIDAGRVEPEDCCISEWSDRLQLDGCSRKLALLRSGGLAWFREYATLDGVIVPARLVSNRFGVRYRVSMPDGKVVWTTARTAAGLAKRSLKTVHCLRPAWYKLHCDDLMSGGWALQPADVNYATGEAAGEAPVQVKDCEPQEWPVQPWEVAGNA